MSRASPIALLSAVLVVLCGCAARPEPPQPRPVAPAPPPAPAPAASAPAPAPAPAPAGIRYGCDHGIEFTVRYGADSATIDAGERGRDELLRDAGGVTPQQTVYSNQRLRAQFGLGADGREAVLNYADPPLVAHCSRQ